jgi:hypothetical protein
MDTIQVGEAVEPESGPRLPSASLRSELPNSDLEPTVHSIVVGLSLSILLNEGLVVLWLLSDIAPDSPTKTSIIKFTPISDSL